MSGKGLDWHASIAMGNSPLCPPPSPSGGHSQTCGPCIQLSGQSPFPGKGYSSCPAPRCGVGLFSGVALGCGYVCSGASLHLGPPLSLLRISRALEVLHWKAPTQYLGGREKASRHLLHLTRFLEYCLPSLEPVCLSTQPLPWGRWEPAPGVGELVCVCSSCQLLSQSTGQSRCFPLFKTAEK